MKTLQLLTASFLLFLTSYCFGQNYFIAHGGLSFPFSDYGDDNENNELASGAATGLNAHIFYTYPLSEFGLGVYGELGLNLNGLKRDYKEQIEEPYEFLGLGNDDFKHSKYFGVPFSFGVNYTHEIDKTYSLYGHFGIAGNFLKVTKFKASPDNGNITTKYDRSFGNGIKIGFGTIVNDQWTVAINIFALGVHEIKGDVAVDLNNSSFNFEPALAEMNVSYMALTVGKKF